MKSAEAKTIVIFSPSHKESPTCSLKSDNMTSQVLEFMTQNSGAYQSLLNSELLPKHNSCNLLNLTCILM